MATCEFFCKGITYVATGELDSEGMEMVVEITRKDTGEHVATEIESASVETIVGWWLERMWDNLPSLRR